MTSYEAIVLMGPPGSGKSFLGNHLASQGIVSYLELEPFLRSEFGTGEEFRSRIAEVGAFLSQSYRDQLAGSERPVAIESTGITDRPLLEGLMGRHRVAFARVRAERAVCIERVVSRASGRNISHTTDRDLIGGFYDAWTEKIAPGWKFDLEADGEAVGSASVAIREFLE